VLRGRPRPSPVPGGERGPRAAPAAASICRSRCSGSAWARCSASWRTRRFPRSAREPTGWQGRPLRHRPSNSEYPSLLSRNGRVFANHSGYATCPFRVAWHASCLRHTRIFAALRFPLAAQMGQAGVAAHVMMEDANEEHRPRGHPLPGGSKRVCGDLQRYPDGHERTRQHRVKWRPAYGRSRLHRSGWARSPLYPPDLRHLQPAGSYTGTI
jgi:hypothetical protein